MRDSELRDVARIADRVPSDGIVVAGLEAELSKIRAAKQVRGYPFALAVRVAATSHLRGSRPRPCLWKQVVQSKQEQLTYAADETVDLAIFTAESTLIEQQVEWNEVCVCARDAANWLGSCFAQ